MQEVSPIVSKIAMFIICNKRKNCCKDWTIAQIIAEVEKAIKTKCFLIINDENDKIIGFASGHRVDLFTMHVRQLLTSKPKILPKFIKALKYFYPWVNYIEAERNKKIKLYTIEQLTKKLSYG